MEDAWWMQPGEIPKVHWFNVCMICLLETVSGNKSH